MDRETILRAPVTPPHAPAYPPVVPRFTDREYLNIVYRTDPRALREIVPEPLELDEPLVRFEVMRMGDVTGYGPYTECGQVVPVRFGAERGEYLHAMYLDNFQATASGREAGAYPKVAGKPGLTVEDGALLGTLDYGSVRVATATMGYKHHPLDPDSARAQLTMPTFMLNLVPGYRGEPLVADLVRTRITDITVKSAYQGPARLELAAHVLAPMADLPVREIVSASHIRTDLTLAPVQPVYDYLAEGAEGKGDGA